MRSPTPSMGTSKYDETISSSEHGPQDRRRHLWLLTRAAHHMRQRSLPTVEDAVKTLSEAYRCPERPVLPTPEATTAFDESKSDAEVRPDGDTFLIDNIAFDSAFVKAVAPRLSEKETTWIDVKGLTNSEITLLAGVLSLNALTIEDLTSSDTPDKIEVVGDYFLCVLTFEKDGVHDRISLVMCDRVVLSVHTNATWIVAEATTRLHAMHLPQLTSEHVFYAVLDVVVDNLAQRVLALQDEVDYIDEIVLMISESERTDVLRRITSSRRKIGLWRANVTLKESILRTVLHQQHSQSFTLRQNYTDVLDHVLQSLARLETARDVISQSNNNFTSLLSMRSAEHANATNDVMKRLTILGGVLMPCNLVTGLFGMNIGIPFMNTTDVTVFYVIVGCMAAFVAVVLLVVYCAGRRGRRQE